MMAMRERYIPHHCVFIVSVQCDRNHFHYSGLSAFPVTLPTMYKTDRVPARFSVVSVQGSELPEVQPVASVLSLLGRVPVRSQALDRPILDLNYPIRSQGRTGRFEYTSIPKLDATEIHYWRHQILGKSDQ